MDFLFADERGEPLNQRNLIARHFKPALERAGLDTSTRVYDLRHTYCTLLIGENIPANVVSESVGHSSAKMTLDVYSHVQPQHRERALAIAERVLLGGGGGS